ncbi:threonine/serine dehydratase [Candidatus Ichthyocystis sparus]|uniref:threonine/serine dehydratase n=1 Tax=Candidatus Ichthyocystis sparus TaxID=1561004 RepID=UPI000B241473|nr:threonine/serine dehydratase [Candidatus Ichthyocystis sparus]
MEFNEYFKLILEADVSRFVRRTPLDLLCTTSDRLGFHVFSKRDDLQPTVYSFKIRGVAYKLSQLCNQQKITNLALVVPSTGNHAISVVHCARSLGYKVTVVMPTCTSDIKVNKVSSMGGEVILSGDSCSESCAAAEEIALKIKATLVHPYDDPDIIVGHGTMAREIVEQLYYQQIKAIFVPIGGGALASSVALYIKKVMPKTKVIGVQYHGCDSMRRSLQEGKIVSHKPLSTFASAISTEYVGKETFRICRELLDDVVVVRKEEVIDAIKEFYRHCRVVLEPAGAASLAALGQWSKTSTSNKTDNVVTLACGANADLTSIFNVYNC